MIRLAFSLFAASLALALDLNAQIDANPRERSPLADTTESASYPTGEAIDVYRAALDLLYKEGAQRPSVIVVHDTIEFPGDDEGPCRHACNRTWSHKSHIDTTAIIAFTRVTPKRPRFKPFDYPVPFALLSYDDREQLRRKGVTYLNSHNLPVLMPGLEERIGLTAKFPGAWGETQFSKVAFNTAHTEALVLVRHWCGEDCASAETLFMKKVAGTWKVTERIPDFAEAPGNPNPLMAGRYPSKGSLRYRGPAGSSPAESEIVADESANAPARSIALDAADVYRAVLDSLYHFQGASPGMIVLTDAIPTSEPLPKPMTKLDAGVVQKYALYRGIREIPASPFTYRLPVKIFRSDSVRQLEKIGAPLITDQNVMDPAYWFGFRKQFPGAWGMVGFSRVAFNVPRTQAMVYSSHQCGSGCNHGDTWVLLLRDGRWQIAERIAGGRNTEWEPSLFPLRYVGLDAKPQAYRRRRAFVQVINTVTNRPVQFLQTRSIGSSGAQRSPALTRTFNGDANGKIDLGVLPFQGIVSLRAPCPDQTHSDSVDIAEVPFTPGPDTTVIRRVDFRECLHLDQSHRMVGAEASISAAEARFVFPFRNATQLWARPELLKTPGTTSFWWEVEWGHYVGSTGDVPVSLWLTATANVSQRPVGSLYELVLAAPLDAMIVCRTCDQPAVFADPDIDHKNVYATIENGRLVFTVRGAKEMREVFPAQPAIVTFSTRIRHKPNGKRDTDDIGESQTIMVNCRISDSTAYSRRRCDAPPSDPFAVDLPGSPAPRRVNVVAITYDGASLMKNIGVRIRSEDKKLPGVVRWTGSQGKFSVLQPPRDSVSFAALCPQAGSVVKTSGQLALYLAPGRDTTIQVIVDPRRCNRWPRSTRPLPS